MSKKNGERKRPEGAEPGPAIKPPGRGPNRGHGLQGGPLKVQYGAEHLRRVLSLSADASTERLCEDAAVEIERLREGQAPAPWPDNE